MSNEWYSQGLTFKLMPIRKPIFQGLIQVFFLLYRYHPRSFHLARFLIIIIIDWDRRQRNSLSSFFADCSSIINHTSNITMNERRYAYIHTHILANCCYYHLLPIKGCVHLKQIHCIFNESIHWRNNDHVNVGTCSSYQKKTEE